MYVPAERDFQARNKRVARRKAICFKKEKDRFVRQSVSLKQQERKTSKAKLLVDLLNQLKPPFLLFKIAVSDGTQQRQINNKKLKVACSPSTRRTTPTRADEFSTTHIAIKDNHELRVLFSVDV